MQPRYVTGCAVDTLYGETHVCQRHDVCTDVHMRVPSADETCTIRFDLLPARVLCTRISKPHSGRHAQVPQQATTERYTPHNTHTFQLLPATEEASQAALLRTALSLLLAMGFHAASFPAVVRLHVDAPLVSVTMAQLGVSTRGWVNRLCCDLALGIVLLLLIVTVLMQLLPAALSRARWPEAGQRRCLICTMLMLHAVTVQAKSAEPPQATTLPPPSSATTFRSPTEHARLEVLVHPLSKLLHALTSAQSSWWPPHLQSHDIAHLSNLPACHCGAAGVQRAGSDS
jgi:hypothetical protein